MTSHSKVSGLSGNEIFCLSKMGLKAGNICVGNSVYALGITGSFKAGFNILAGGEIPEITSLIHDGRVKAISRMLQEAESYGGIGVTGVTTELVNHGSNIEFLSIGSVLHQDGLTQEKISFATSADAQALYCQWDCGFKPIRYAIGNVAYSIGLGGSIGGALRTFQRGEVPQFSEIFDRTRHLALERIKNEAKHCGANAVIGINTTITPFMGSQEMLMLGTASYHQALTGYASDPVTSDMTNEEMWNMVNIGYMPLSLVMGVSVYSLGIAGGIKSAFQSMVRGEVSTLTTLLYEAREKALSRIQLEANRLGADEVVGVKIHIYDIGPGLVEFLAIGTAVKKRDGISTVTQHLIPQAIIKDRDTFFQNEANTRAMNIGHRKAGNQVKRASGPFALLAIILYFAMLLFAGVLKHLFK